MSDVRNSMDHIWDEPDFDAFFKRYAKEKLRKIKKGDTIFYQGDETSKILYIKKGFVKLFQTAEDGHEPVVYLYGPSTILGLRALTSKEHEYWHGARAMTDCEVIPMSTDSYKEILSKHPSYIIDLLYLFIQRLNYTERRLYGFITAETTARVAAFLYDCALRYGIESKRGIKIPIPLTHQSISEFVGAARESVTVSLNKLVRQKVVTHSRGEITIINLGKLKEIAKLS